MLIRFTRLTNERHRLEFVRDDGTSEARELETRSALLHDLVHYAVETEAGLMASFYGQLAGGKTYESLTAEPSSEAAPLARLIYTKTAGNPFFAIQFLTTLYQERLLTYDDRDGSWHWDLAQIRRQRFTDNVVELMVGKLLRLSATTQEALTLGGRGEVLLFDLN